MNNYQKLIKFTLIISMVIFLSYSLGLFHANSRFIDINDIAEITNCQRVMVENCEISRKLLAWYFVPDYLFLFLPPSIITFIVYVLDMKKIFNKFILYFPYIWSVIMVFIKFLNKSALESFYSLIFLLILYNTLSFVIYWINIIILNIKK